MRRGCIYRKLLTAIRRLSDEIPTDVKQSVGIPYKKLLCMVDLTKDFFFSYYFNIMRSFQKNICNHESGATLCKKMFVWNEFLTWGIRHLRNTVWTVALVYAFFKQKKKTTGLARPGTPRSCTSSTSSPSFAGSTSSVPHSPSVEPPSGSPTKICDHPCPSTKP
ncbi:hypothetical protein YC2023_051837 [Brassica napus]